MAQRIYIRTVTKQDCSRVLLLHLLILAHSSTVVLLLCLMNLYYSSGQTII